MLDVMLDSDALIYLKLNFQLALTDHDYQFHTFDAIIRRLVTVMRENGNFIHLRKVQDGKSEVDMCMSGVYQLKSLGGGAVRKMPTGQVEKSYKFNYFEIEKRTSSMGSTGKSKKNANQYRAFKAPPITEHIIRIK